MKKLCSKCKKMSPYSHKRKSCIHCGQFFEKKPDVKQNTQSIKSLILLKKNKVKIKCQMCTAQTIAVVQAGKIRCQMCKSVDVKFLNPMIYKGELTQDTLEFPYRQYLSDLNNLNNCVTAIEGIMSRIKCHPNVKWQPKVTELLDILQKELLENG